MYLRHPHHVFFSKFSSIFNFLDRFKNCFHLTYFIHLDFTFLYTNKSFLNFIVYNFPQSCFYLIGILTDLFFIFLSLPFPLLNFDIPRICNFDLALTPGCRAIRTRGTRGITTKPTIKDRLEKTFTIWSLFLAVFLK